MNNLLYLPLDIENPPMDYLDYLNSLDINEIYADEYRNCSHVPIMYNLNKADEFIWMPWAHEMPKLKQWCEDVLFKITKMKSRIMIITTPNGEKNPPHIDCSPEMFSTPQHKFRYVFQGNVDDLVFIGQDKTAKPTPIDKPFIMSGKWPHEMPITIFILVSTRRDICIYPKIGITISIQTRKWKDFLPTTTSKE